MRDARARFDRLRRRARIGIAIEALAWLAAAAVLYVFASYAVDRSLRLEVGYRAFLLLGFVAALAVIALRRLVRPLRFELGDDELALAIERRDPELRQALISAVQFERDLAAQRARADSPELMQRVVADVEGRLAGLPFGRALDGRRTARCLGLLALLVAAVVAWSTAFADEARLWARRNLALSGVAWPRDTHLAFLDVDPDQPLRVAERDDLTLRVRATGVVPERVSLACTFASGEDAERPMEQVGEDVFTVTLESLLEGLTARASGGDGETRVLQIELVPRPVISDLRIVVAYPGYLGREPEPVADLGADLRIPHGTELEVVAESDKPLVRAELVFAEDLRKAAEILDDGHTLRGRLVPSASGSLTVDALDRDRLGPARTPQVYVRLVPDEVPKVDFETRGIGSLITADARIPGQLTVRDDHGLEAVAATLQITAAVAPTEATVDDAPPPFESAPVTGLGDFVAGADEFDTATVLDLQALDPRDDPIPENRRVQPGQLLALRFTARDNFAPEAHEGASETMTFRIVTREKLIEELRRRQGEQRRELELVLERERALRDALAEIVSPASGDPRAEQAALEILGLARQQQTLGRRAAGVADRYEAILDEYANNRLFEPNVTRSKHARIVSPLRTLAVEDFPQSSAAAATFAGAGTEDARGETIAACDGIIATIVRVLEEMEQTEDIAALLETLRLVIETEERARALVEKRRDEGVEDLFDPPDKK